MTHEIELIGYKNIDNKGKNRIEPDLFE